MRDIKFRGKDLRTGKWLCGSLMQWKDRCFIIPFDSAPGTGWIEVDPETTGEFTSQLDKNGKEVYEHDRTIVRDNRGNTFTARIEWGNRGFVQIEEEGNGGEYTYTDWFFEIEVIGNIHDNPGSGSMKSPDIKTSDPWCCGNCGSPDVQQQAWIDLGTGEVISYNDCDRGDFWCESCEDHHYPARESELLRNADEWWNRSDFRQMERVTGYRQLDFDSEDGCQAFIDACDGWWNGKTTREKISIHFKTHDT